MLESCDASLVKKPHLDIRTETCQGGRKSYVGLTQGSRGARGDGILDVLQCTTSLPSSLFVVQVDTLLRFLD